MSLIWTTNPENDSPNSRGDSPSLDNEKIRYTWFAPIDSAINALVHLAQRLDAWLQKAMSSHSE